MPGNPSSYVLPDSLGASALVYQLTERLTVALDRSCTSDCTFVDTFDGRLHAEGITLDRAAPPPPGLADIVEDRALLPVARVRSRSHRLRVLNGDAKTVVRLEVEEPVLVRRGQPPLALTPRVHVAPVRGYERAAERVHRVLATDLDLAPAGEPVVDEAVRAGGGDPAGVSAKVAVPLRPEERADVAFVALCGRLAQIMDDNLPGTMDDVDPEFLHDYRVALRRTRSLLRELKGVLPPAERERFREEMRWLQQVTGPVRDLDVHLADLAGFAASLGDDLAQDLAPLVDLLRRRRAKELRAMRRAVRSPRRVQLREDWLAFLGAVPALDDTDDRPKASQPIGDVARKRVRSVYDAMRTMGESIDDTSPGLALHELRKRGKELRYLLELFGPLFPGAAARALVASLKSLQDVLGRFQDREVQADALRDLGDELVAVERGPAALMALGLVVDRLGAEQAAARADFAARFERFSSKETRDTVAELTQ